MSAKALIPYHESLIRGYAAKHGVTVAHLGYDEYAGLWHVTLRSPVLRFAGRYREARVLDVIRRIKEMA